MAVGGALYAIHSDPWPAAATLCVGIFVDLDHLLDLWVYQKYRGSHEKLMDVFDTPTWVKSYVILHALEFLPVLVALVLLCERSWLWAGIFCGYALHLIMDMKGNQPFPLAYSLVYRIRHGFDAKYIWRDSHPPGTARYGKRR
ncbi:MAG: hypothetical protein ABIK28_08685 [Planctomycetota bacterium]